MFVSTLCLGIPEGLFAQTDAKQKAGSDPVPESASISGYVFKDLLPGSLLLVILGLWGVFRFVAHRPDFSFPTGDRFVFSLFLGSLVFGVYVSGFNEIIIGNKWTPVRKVG